MGEPTRVWVETPAATKISEVHGNYVLSDTVCSITNINIATVPALVSAKLPGIGQTLAQRIVDYRDENGLFQSEADLEAVRGIGSKTVEKIAAKITV